MSRASSFVGSAWCVSGLLLVAIGFASVTRAQASLVATLVGWGLAFTGFATVGAGLVLLVASARSAS